MASKTETPTAATETATAATPMPRLGELVTVKVAEGAVLINNETGQPFVAGEATPQTVTVTLLRRLADGDLVLV